MKEKALYWFFKVVGMALLCVFLYAVIAGWINLMRHNEAYRLIMADFLRPIVNLF